MCEMEMALSLTERLLAYDLQKGLIDAKLKKTTSRPEFRIAMRIACEKR